MAGKHAKRRSHRGLIATVVGVVSMVVGASLIGVSIASQERILQLPTAADGSGAGRQIPEGSEEWLRPGTQASTDPATGVVGPTLPRSKPVSLDIPSIGVHSEVRYLGQTAEGALETPAPGPYYNDAAWYRYSPAPGSLGPAIVLGHVDSVLEGPSVFFRLGELKPGNRVSITRTDDSIAVFVVDEVRRYAKDDFPTELVYNDINHAGLRIVTCGGAFDDTTGHYVDNIVVFASLVGSREK